MASSSLRRLAIPLLAAATTATACNAGSEGPAALPLGAPAEVSASASASPGEGATAAPASSAAPTATTSVSPSARTTLAIYYLHDSGRGIRLQREWRSVPRTTTPIRAAVDAMLHLAPLDPDYTSLWPKATTIRGISVGGDTATVDLSADAARGSAGSEAEDVSLQQLVHTVTAAASGITRVRLRIDGRERDTLWGHADARGAMRRGSSTTYLATVSLETPQEGSRVGRSLRFGGSANTFEANVVWRITKRCAGGAACPGTPVVLRRGFATATSGSGTRGTWTVTTTLPDAAFTDGGWIEIRAFESSPQDGSETFPDTKVVRAVR